MKTFARSVVVALAVAVVLVAALPALAHEAPKSLYHRLGGYDAIAGVTDDFIGRLAGDPELGRFFQGSSADSLRRIRQLVVDQVCEATGGPCYYIGRPMKQAHQGLKITKAHWDKSVGHFVATLDKFEVPDKEKHELLAIVGTLEADIVEAPAP